MTINNISGANSAVWQPPSLDNVVAQKQAAATKTPQDVVELSKNYKPDVKNVEALKADLTKNVKTLRQMVQKLLEKQGGHSNAALDKLVEIDAQTRAQAEQMISEDGYWGVNKTAERILNFAKSISGGDPAKIDVLRDAVMKGFAEAEKAWGGKLPDICRQTIDKVMAGFDEWEKSGKAE